MQGAGIMMTAEETSVVFAILIVDIPCDSHCHAY
jgi:hypothetical protein